MKEFVVADISDSYRVVLNAGENEGVALGDLFLIYGISKEIKDPLSGEVLEKLEVIRGIGKVIHVQKKICTVETTNKTQITLKRPSLATLFYPLSGEETKSESILKPFDSPQVGDFARRMTAR